jgi:4-amino-4-deoxy-L-arabinose transferase-like glycosyltransferase
VLVGSFLLGLLYLSNVPPGYGPDEPSHLGYVRFLAEGHGLPVLGRETDPNGPTYEAHQPPLYYLLALPFYEAGESIGGANGAWIAIRLFTLLCGLGTVLLVYLIVLRLFPDKPEVAAGAAAFAGWLPSQCFLFSVVSNDPLTEFGFTLTFYLCILYFLRNDNKPHPIWIGLAAGATVLTKSSAVLLLALVPFFLLFTGPRSPKLQLAEYMRATVLFLAGALICLPWLIRNTILYGDPLGWSAFLHYFSQVMHSPTPQTLAERMRVPYSPGWYWGQAVLGWAFRDSLGMWLFTRPGSPVPLKVSLPGMAYSLWGLAWLASTLGFLRYWSREGRKQSPEWKRAWSLMGGAALLLIVAYLRLNAVFFWAHSRYIFPAVAPLALVWSVGWSRWIPVRYRSYLIWAVSGSLFFISLYAGFGLLGGFFEGLSQPLG